MEKENINQKWKNYNGNIVICCDLEITDIPKIIAENNIRDLQLSQFKTPSKKTWQVLNQFYKEYPNIGLNILWEHVNDLSFYDEIPNVRRFKIATYNIKDYAKLVTNTKLKHFGIDDTKSKAVTVSFIKEFKDLESLYINGMKKGLTHIADLKKLKKLTLRGVKMDNLNFLSELKNLEELHLLYGSFKDLTSLSNVKQLKSITFDRVRQIDDFNFLNTLNNLEEIEFEGMSKLKEIPNLSELKKLKKINIENNSGLEHIKFIEKIENLKAFRLTFPENFKASHKRNLLKEAENIVLNSNTIKYTNIIRYSDKAIKQKIMEKGVENWKWDIKI